MNKLVLVRYGEYTDGHLNEQGVQTMILASERLKPLVQNKNACIISAQIPRAIESAEVLSKYLDISPVRTFLELYAAENIPIDLDAAIKIINSAGEKYDIVIAVVSREYIETLSSHILKSLVAQKTTGIYLDRGEVLILDYETKDITIL